MSPWRNSTVQLLKIYLWRLHCFYLYECFALEHLYYFTFQSSYFIPYSTEYITLSLIYKCFNAHHINMRVVSRSPLGLWLTTEIWGHNVQCARPESQLMLGQREEDIIMPQRHRQLRLQDVLGWFFKFCVKKDHPRYFHPFSICNNIELELFIFPTCRCDESRL